jgi:hypothetical protein
MRGMMTYVIGLTTILNSTSCILKTVWGRFSGWKALPTDMYVASYENRYSRPERDMYVSSGALPSTARDTWRRKQNG